MNLWQTAKREIFKAVVFFGTGIAIMSVGYTAAVWPATPAGETAGGKYEAKFFPTGAVLSFKTATCPTGWSPADGANSNPDLRGEFIR